MTVVTEFPRAVREVQHDWIPLADGTRLAVRYWLPEDALESPVPALLEYIPYCKRDGTTARDEAMHPYYAGHGYASLRVDLRGAGESEGVMLDEYLQQELDDGVEVIAWIAAQPWCTGKVGLFGKSWGGFNALQIAALRPPALKAIMTVDGTDDRYSDDVHYMGGCMNGNNPTWAFSMFQRIARPPDPKLAGEGWRTMWEERLAVARPWILDWVRHQRRDAFWKHGSVIEDYSRIECAVYAVGGWADSYTNCVLRLMQGLDVPRKAIIGPWGHQYPHQGLPGPAIGGLKDALRFWDHWLKGEDTGVMDEPMIRAWMQENVVPQAAHAVRPGRWIGVRSWPSDEVEARRLPLAPGILGEAAEADIPVATPQTLGEGALAWIVGGAGDPDDATDQRSDDALSVCFDSAPLDQPLEIFGTPVLELEVSADRPCAFLCARLCEVVPGGPSTRVSYGVLNLTHRDSHENPEPMEPGRRYRVRIVLNDVAHRFSRGSRIRLALSNSYWPIIWPSPEPVTVTVHTAGGALLLPVWRGGTADAELPDLGPPESSAVYPTTVLSPSRPMEVTVTRDVATGRLTVRKIVDGGKKRFADGWEAGTYATTEKVIAPEDPTSAEVRSFARVEGGREGQRFAIEVEQTMGGDARDFVVSAGMKVWESGTQVFNDSWLERIARNLV